MRKPRSLRPLAFTAALCLLIAPLAAACGSSSDAGGKASSGKDDAKTLVVYSAEPASVAGYEQALTSFEKANSVTVKFVSYESADFLTQFPNAVRAGTQIDVILANGQDVRTLVSKKLLSPLTGLDTASLIPPALEPFNIDGSQYAVGVNTMYTTGVALNTELMDELGLAKPATFDDLKANVAKLKGTGVSLFSVPGGNIYLWPIWYMQTLQQASGGTPSELTTQTLKGEVPFTDSRYVDAMAAMKQLGEMGIFQPGYAGVDQDGANATMVQGKAVMFYGGTWDISAIAEKAQFPLDVTFFPSNGAGVESKAAGGTAIAAAVYAKVDAGRKGLAQELVQFLASKEGSQATLTATEAGFPLPTVTGVQVESSDVAKQVATTLAPATFTFLDWSWPKQVTAAFQQAIPAVVAGRKDPTKAMDEVQAAFEAAKAEGWTY